MTDNDTSEAKDLTAPEAVERAIGMCRAHGLHGTEAALRALSAALEAEKARAEAAEAEIARMRDENELQRKIISAVADEIDRLRFRAFATNKKSDVEAYYKAASLYFQERRERALNRADPTQDERVKALVEAAKDFQNFVSLAAPELTDEDRGACAGGVEIDIALEEALAALTAYREARK